MYGLVWRLDRDGLPGVRASTLARWLPVAGWLWSWRAGAPVWLVAGLGLIIILANLVVWQARRDHYLQFAADEDPGPAIPYPALLPPNEKIAVAASGPFVVSGRSESLIQRPAHYWHVPAGDHIVMAQERPGTYLYQFFSAETIREVRSGWLLHGRQPARALAIRFSNSWGPEANAWDGADTATPAKARLPKAVTIYLSGASAADHQRIWRGLCQNGSEPGDTGIPYQNFK